MKLLYSIGQVASIQVLQSKAMTTAGTKQLQHPQDVSASDPNGASQPLLLSGGDVVDPSLVATGASQPVLPSGGDDVSPSPAGDDGNSAISSSTIGANLQPLEMARAMGIPPRSSRSSEPGAVSVVPSVA